MSIIVAERDHPLRDRLEGAVRTVFLAQYGAHVSGFPDRLVASLDSCGEPMAIAGLRLAADGLFSQAYLDEDAALAVGRALGRPLNSAQLVEVSSLAAPRPGAALDLIGAAIRLGLDLGATVGLFTATARLRALLRRSGILALDLGPARRERVAHPAAWGSYYLHDPRVVAVAAEHLPAAWIGASATVSDRPAGRQAHA